MTEVLFRFFVSAGRFLCTNFRVKRFFYYRYSKLHFSRSKHAILNGFRSANKYVRGQSIKFISFVIFIVASICRIENSLRVDEQIYDLGTNEYFNCVINLYRVAHATTM